MVVSVLRPAGVALSAVIARGAIVPSLPMAAGNTAHPDPLPREGREKRQPSSLWGGEVCPPWGGRRIIRSASRGAVDRTRRNTATGGRRPRGYLTAYPRARSLPQT